MNRKCYQNILNKIKLNTVYNQLKEIIHPKVESCLHLHLLSDLYLILYYFCSFCGAFCHFWSLTSYGYCMYTVKKKIKNIFNDPAMKEEYTMTNIMIDKKGLT